MDTAVALDFRSGDRTGRETDAVSALHALVADDIARVNDIILARLESSVPLIAAVASHLIKSGGKRLRPLITLNAARLCDYHGDSHLNLAAAIEFIHTATLLHDDVVDESALRRGRQSANELWGNQASVLVGDFLFSRSFNLMVDVGDIKTLDILATASSVIAEGEVLQLASIADIELSRESYLDIVRAKTAALFAAAARVGGVISKCSADVETALESFGLNFGIAFQLVDDALDYSGRQLDLGKTIGDDFKECKITLPVVLAYSAGDAEERAFWRRVIEDDQQTEGDFERAQALIERHGTIGETLHRARGYSDKARAALQILPRNAYRDAFDNLIDFCVERAY